MLYTGWLCLHRRGAASNATIAGSMLQPCLGLHVLGWNRMHGACLRVKSHNCHPWLPPPGTQQGPRSGQWDGRLESGMVFWKVVWPHQTALLSTRAARCVLQTKATSAARTQWPQQGEPCVSTVGDCDACSFLTQHHVAHAGQTTGQAANRSFTRTTAMCLVQAGRRTPCGVPRVVSEQPRLPKCKVPLYSGRSGTSGAGCHLRGSTSSGSHAPKSGHWRAGRTPVLEYQEARWLIIGVPGGGPAAYPAPLTSGRR
jgi:hypothetical protein